MQTRISSFIETLLNVLIGFFTTLIFSPLIYGLSGIQANRTEMTVATLWFTALSIGRSYIIRRWFNNVPSKNEWQVYEVNLQVTTIKVPYSEKFVFAAPSEFVLSEYVYRFVNKHSDMIRMSSLEPIIRNTNTFYKPTNEQLDKQEPYLITPYITQ